MQRDNEGNPIKQTVSRLRGGVSSSFKEKYKLDKNTRPDEYMEIMLPYRDNKIFTDKDLTFQKLMKWTNTKAMLAGAGRYGICYSDFRDFTAQEIRQHIGLYILNGLSPSPRVEYKLRSQQMDKIHGNDFVYRSFGKNAERRHRHFKCFFSCQNPTIYTPCRKQYPNWNVRPLLSWMNFLFPSIW